MNLNKIPSFIITIILLCSCVKDKEIYAIPIVEKTHNFGNIGVYDTINYDFVIKNISQVPLKIKQIGTSCGCTAAIISDSVISNNNIAKIHVKFIPNIRKIGKVKNSIVIKANTNPEFTTLYLIGKVE